MKFSGLLAGAVSGIAMLNLAACGGEDGEAAKAASKNSADDVQCVQLAPGDYYWDGSNFVVSGPALPGKAETAPRSTAASVPAESGWAAEMERSFPDLGFPWMGLHAREPVAVLTGIAPDANAKQTGFAAGKAAVQENAAASGVTLIVDGISLENAEQVTQNGPGAALTTLIQKGASRQTCQAAFNETMEGRTILFQSNLAIVSPTSQSLLDALTGVALLCEDHSIEIGGHTDSRGSNDYNEIISQQRADAVRDYMIEKGVDPDALTAKGYGESRPLDPAENYKAWAKNRRMEFKVSGRR
ncbi:hypothetical protein HY29_05975 [Hyphomonas beringensis]|uniref:OmpA-like domain-containing protein n=1 Tax=Hyphomonas beringensis TaxID=1280946 RepID=A0A062TZE5_9PROT|nr:OmpA family protein [Hyphomonas beringensis]KCZ51412.1 hypothetical protein HY29_05975 [Hyphomonas beringensis]